MSIHFIELSSFKRSADKLLSQEGVRGLQNELLENPEKGSLIRGTGGVRKVRVAREGGGKSGGFRALYFYKAPQIYLLMLYPKNVQDNISDETKAILRKLVKEIQ